MSRFAAVRNTVVVGVLHASTPPALHVPTGMTFIDIDPLPEVTVGWFYSSDIFSEGVVSQKQQFVLTMQAHMTELGRVIDKSQALVSAFVDRGYDVAASDPITDADLVAFGVIVYDLGIAINLLQQLRLLVVQPAFETTISKWREL